jgi:hypothetical protein
MVKMVSLPVWPTGSADCGFSRFFDMMGDGEIAATD